MLWPRARATNGLTHMCKKLHTVLAVTGLVCIVVFGAVGPPRIRGASLRQISPAYVSPVWRVVSRVSVFSLGVNVENLPGCCRCREVGVLSGPSGNRRLVGNYDASTWHHIERILRLFREYHIGAGLVSRKVHFGWTPSAINISNGVSRRFSRLEVADGEESPDPWPICIRRITVGFLSCFSQSCGLPNALFQFIRLKVQFANSITNPCIDSGGTCGETLSSAGLGFGIGDQLIGLMTRRFHNLFLLMVDSGLYSTNTRCNQDQENSDFFRHIGWGDSSLSLAVNTPDTSKKTRLFMISGFALWIGSWYGCWRES